MANNTAGVDTLAKEMADRLAEASQQLAEARSDLGDERSLLKTELGLTRHALADERAAHAATKKELAEFMLVHTNLDKILEDIPDDPETAAMAMLLLNKQQAEQIAALTAERDVAEEESIRQESCRDHFEARVRDLEAALRKYGKHGPSSLCPWPISLCTCGFKAALAGVPAVPQVGHAPLCHHHRITKDCPECSPQARKVGDA